MSNFVLLPPLDYKYQNSEFECLSPKLHSAPLTTNAFSIMESYYLQNKNPFQLLEIC